MGNFFDIWSTTDYIVWGFILFTVLFVLSDILFDYTEYFIKTFKLNSKREDFLFSALFIIWIIFFILNSQFNLLGKFIALINYKSYKLSILRNDIITPMINSYLILSAITPFLSAFIAYKKNKGTVKWFFISLFFNILALIYLLKIIKKLDYKSDGRH